MERDLSELLAAFLAGPTEESRHGALVERLRSDPSFRRAFAAELAMIGRIRAVQSPEPRWLALEDEIGGEGPREGDLERRVLEAADREFRRRSLRRRLGLAAAVLLSAGAAAAILVPRGGVPPAAAPQPLAVVTHIDGVEWEAGGVTPLRAGETVTAGRLGFRAGRLTLSLLNGVTCTLEGPADMDLVSLDRIACRQGGLRVRVPRGAEGFSVMAPGCAVVDLGTDFGLLIPPHGLPRVTVFEGKAELSILREDGSTLRSTLLEGRSAAEIDSTAGLIRPAGPFPLPPPPQPPLPTLEVSSEYAAEVRRSGPWGHWRFGTADRGIVPNEIPGGPALRVIGRVSRNGGTAVFERGNPDAYLTVDGLWSPSRERGYAAECWVLSEAYDRATLVSLSPPPETTGAEGHCLLVELTARSRDLFHAPGAVRFLHRWPPGAAGGTNVFSRTIYRPYRWIHVLAQRRIDRMELYLDGEPAGTAPLDPREDIVPCRVFFGRLVEHPRPELGQIRPFTGRLAEPALYDRALEPEEIRRHAAAGGPR